MSVVGALGCRDRYTWTSGATSTAGALTLRRHGGHGGGHDETARLDPQHLVDRLVPVRVGETVEGGSQRRRVGQQGRDVLEDDPGLREVRDVADECREALRFGQRRFPFLRGRGGWLAE